MKKSFTILLYLLSVVCIYAYNGVTTITEGYYFIVSAGAGNGYSGGPYNDEGRMALYNKDGQVRWKQWTQQSYDEIYYISKSDNDWYIKNYIDNTYINKGNSTYACDIYTSENPETPQTIIKSYQDDKFVFKYKDNPYVYALRSSHNGASGKTEGDLTIWGSPEEALNYKMNVWYFIPVSESTIELAEKDYIIHNFDAIISDYVAMKIKAGETPGSYKQSNIDTFLSTLVSAKKLSKNGSNEEKLAAIDSIKSAYSKVILDVNPIVEGYYSIISAGYGKGSPITNSSQLELNYENKFGVYSDEILKWKSYSISNPKFVYKFYAKNNGWILQNIVDNSYVGSISSSGEIFTGNQPIVQNFTCVSEGKFAWNTINNFCNALFSSHDGPKEGQQFGNITTYGTIEEASEYGINQWYIKPISEQQLASMYDTEKAKSQLITILSIAEAKNPENFTDKTKTALNNAIKYGHECLDTNNYYEFADAVNIIKKAIISLQYANSSNWTFASESSVPQKGKTYVLKNNSTNNLLSVTSGTNEDTKVAIVNQIWLLEETGNEIDEYKTYYLYSFAEKKYWCKDEFNQTDGLDGYSLYGNIGFNASLTTDKSKAMEVTILKSGSSPSWRTDDGNQGNEGYIIACNKENNRCYKLGEKDFNVAMQYSNNAVVWSFYEATEANEYLLTGTPIGSISVDYNNGNTRSTTTNTPAMAFDDDYSTIYASYDRFYTYVGLDLEEKHVITKIEYAPRKNYQSRMVLGVFEGANNSDFSDAVPLFTIKDAPEYDKMTPAEINCSRGFRYVRYVGPNDVRCNVSELKFYGHKSEGNDSKLYQMTNIPLLVIHTENAKDVTSKSNYVYGIISVISNNGKTIFTDSLGIKGRGNASWDFPKKPYKIKLFNKTKLLGMPSKAKEWTLINNYGDKTMLRNILAMETSRRFDMEYTPSVRLVNVMLNGEYKGTYQLFDQIEIRKNRIDIDELTPDIVDGEELTGGYHIEIDAYASGSEKFTSKRGMPISLKEPAPEDINEQQRNYIKNVFDDMESSVFSTDYQNPVNGYRSRLDIDSFLKYFLIQEFSGNTDGYWSVHMYKKRGDIKLYSGPIWDFDLAFENDARTHPINSLTEYLSLSGRSSAASGMKELLRRIVNDNKQEITECWSNARNYNNLSKEYFNNFIDSLVQEIDQSQELNYMRWNILSSKVHQNFQALGDYHKEIDYLKNWIQERFDWMDNKIGLLEKRVDVTYLALSETELDIKENTKADLIVTTLPEDATHKELIWSSSNPDVAIVKDGSITALTAGTSIITATTTDGTDISASCKVNVYSIDIDEFGIVSVRGKLSNSNIDEVKALTDITAVNLTNADISGLIADDLQFGQNILTTVSPDSHIHGVNIINNGVCDNLLLIDNLSFAPISQFMANNVSFTKTMYEGWNTLVLPFSTDIPERVKAYAFTKATDTTLIFKEITQQIPANTPIICKTEDGISSNVTFVSESVPIELSDFKDADFVGTYNTLSKSYTYGKYVISDNREYFNLSNGDVSIPAFNCYYESNNTNIHFSDEPIRGYARAESGILYIVIEDITGVAKHKVQYLSHGDIFNLQGVKVESEGINIKGKKKYIK